TWRLGSQRRGAATAGTACLDELASPWIPLRHGAVHAGPQTRLLRHRDIRHGKRGYLSRLVLTRRGIDRDDLPPRAGYHRGPRARATLFFSRRLPLAVHQRPHRLAVA